MFMLNNAGTQKAEGSTTTRVANIRITLSRTFWGFFFSELRPLRSPVRWSLDLSDFLCIEVRLKY